MTSVDNSDPELKKLYDKIRDDSNDTTWGCIRYTDKKGKKLAVRNEGKGTFQNFVAALPNDECLYAYIRVNITDEVGKRTKFLLISWAPDNSPFILRARMSVDKAAVKEIFQSFALEIYAANANELNFQEIINQLKKVGGNDNPAHANEKPLGKPTNTYGHAHKTTPTKNEIGKLEKSNSGLKLERNNSGKNESTSTTTTSTTTAVTTKSSKTEKVDKPAVSAILADKANQTKVKPSSAQKATGDIDTKNLNFVGVVLGEGSVSKVEKAELNGKFVSVKLVHKPSYVDDILQHKELAHSNLVKVIGSSTVGEDGEQNIVVLEHMEISLYQFISTKWVQLKDNGKLQVSIALDIAKGIEYLHERDILHYNLNSKKILLDSNLIAKVTDYGTKFKHLEQNLLNEDKQAFFAPEAYATKVITKESNVYGYGLILWEIFTGIEFIKFYENIASNEPPEKVPPGFENLILECTNDDPKARPNFPKIVKRLTTIQLNL